MPAVPNTCGETSRTSNWLRMNVNTREKSCSNTREEAEDSDTRAVSAMCAAAMTKEGRSALKAEITVHKNTTVVSVPATVELRNTHK